MGNEIIDLDAIRARNEDRCGLPILEEMVICELPRSRHHEPCGIVYGCGSRHHPFVEAHARGACADIDALLAEVERLRRVVGGVNPCPKCGTLHLVRKGFTIDAQRERYPQAFNQAPDRIVLYGGSVEIARKIVEALEDRIIAGSGCDNFYVLEGD